MFLGHVPGTPAWIPGSNGEPRLWVAECHFPSEPTSNRLFPVSTTCSGECSSDHAGHDLTRRARRATVLEMRHLTHLGLTAACLVIAAGCSSGNVTAPRGSPVPGTLAFVDHHMVSPIYVGQFPFPTGPGCRNNWSRARMSLPARSDILARSATVS
jgi:hypothetical protein